MQTLDDMRSPHLLSDEQHAQIGARIAAGKTLAMPVINDRFLSQSAIPGGDARRLHRPFVAAETKKWAQVVKASGAKVG